MDLNLVVLRCTNIGGGGGGAQNSKSHTKGATPPFPKLITHVTYTGPYTPDISGGVFGSYTDMHSKVLHCFMY